MKDTMITSADKFNRGTTVNSKHAFIANNKLEVALDRYPNLKGTEIERIIRTFTAIIEEAEKHENEGDNYFEYKCDQIDSKVRVDMIISLIYKKDGNLEEIMDSVCFRNAKVEAMELSDHYWAINYNK